MGKGSCARIGWAGGTIERSVQRLSASAYLIARIAADLGLLVHFDEFGEHVPEFFGSEKSDALVVPHVEPFPLYERLVTLDPDGDMYFACLATLHKARLKYETILETQAMPTLEQVGPRGLLQYGKISPRALVAFLLWRKWFFDIDNRAGQETGYLFEPVIANAVGGTPVPASRSPVKRHGDGRKGRQVDCLLGNKAYDLKIRMTDAASGQGRWREELDYPLDCRRSAYVPVLVVLDGTPNQKLAEITQAFLNQAGEVHVGAPAWEHLDRLAGPTMALFLERYVRAPLDHLLSEAPRQRPELRARLDGGTLRIALADEEMLVLRRNGVVEHDGHDAAPDDLHVDEA